MAEPGPQAAAPGRPTEGQALAQSLAAGAARRDRSRNVHALRRLGPFLVAHSGRALASLVFLLLSTGATLGMSGAIRLVVDHLTDKGLDPATVDQRFLVIGAVAATLAVSTALRFYFVTSLGERVVADLRKATYGHILTLDPAFFLQTRTGEVLSRLTTDIAIVENLLATSVSVALRNLLTLIGALILLVFVSPQLTGLVLLTFPFVITVNLLGNPDNGVIASGYVGALLVAGSFLAVGSALSAATRNQVIAFVLAVAVCFVFAVASYPLVTDFLSRNTPALAEIARRLAVLDRYQAFTRGIVSLRDLVFFASFIGFWLFLNTVLVDQRKAD